MWLQSILVCTSLSIVKSWTLPPRDFLANFATEHDRTSIIIYLPEQKIPQKWFKNYFVGGSNIDIPTFFVIPSLVSNFSWISTTNEDLHIFVPDDKDQKTMANSVDIFMEIYALRDTSRSEHWLLDISYWDGDSKKASNDIAELLTDLDDDLYWYTYSAHETVSINLTNGNLFDIELFEVYKINEDMKMIVNYYGNWSKTVGMKFIEEQKWIRRKNLQVNHTNF